MNRALLAMGAVLAISLLFNAVAFVRLSNREAPSVRPGPTRSVGVEPDSSSPVLAAPVPAPAGRPASAPVADEAPKPSRPAPAPIITDPKVREVLEAQDAFGAFWKELDRVFKARGKIEEPRFTQAVLSATADYLQLGEADRVAFADVARNASAAVFEARKEYEAARAALPPKDKSDAAGYAAYQQQKNAVDTRYDERLRAAADMLRPCIDAGRARHAEFIAQADKWLRNLAPRP